MNVDVGYELFMGAKALGLFKNAKGESWVNRVAYFGSEKVGDGEDNIIAFLRTPSELQQLIALAVIEGMEHGLEAAAQTVSEDTASGAEPDDLKEPSGDD